MTLTKPLKKEEVPTDYQDRIDFDSCRLVPAPQQSRPGKNYAVVDVTCDICGEVKQTAINDLRNWIAGSKKNFPGTHRDCKYSRKIVVGGYVKIYQPNHPRNSGRYVPEHILVMEAALGRYLTAEESVHHINGDSRDNSLENLQLRKKYHGKGQKWQCADCGSHNVKAVTL